MTQAEALRVLKTGAHVFLTGEPGSGKTYTVNAYVRFLREHGIEPAVTASTGIAATHIGGMTLHSWSGIGVREYLTEYDVEAIAHNKNVRRRARATNTLIIDEVSMLPGTVLDMVDHVLRAARERPEPFGGMQVLLVGDFFQLPPVVRRDFSGDDISGTPFAFTAPSWRSLNPFVCYLEEQYRQSDSRFLGLLTALRRSENISDIQETLEMCKKDESTISTEAPRLFSHNADVDRLNAERLRLLSGKPYTYTMTGRGSESVVAALKRGCLSPEILTLKEGARVMFTKNDPTGAFVNGTLGVVSSIAMSGAPTVRTTEGKYIDVVPSEWVMEEGGSILGRITQLPLRLAWAVTVHKSQGMTLDEAVIDLSRAFEYGQGYVALSRVRDLSGLHLIGVNRRALEVHPEVLERDGDFRELSHAARERFALMLDTEHSEYQTAFLRASGGSEEVRTPEERAQKAKRTVKGASFAETRTHLKAGRTVKDIARARALKESTIIDHIQQLYMREEIDRADVERSISSSLKKALPKIYAAFKRHGTERLTPVHHELKGVYSFDEIKLARILYSA